MSDTTQPEPIPPGLERMLRQSLAARHAVGEAIKDWLRTHPGVPEAEVQDAVRPLVNAYHRAQVHLLLALLTEGAITPIWAMAVDPNDPSLAWFSAPEALPVAIALPLPSPAHGYGSDPELVARVDRMLDDALAQHAAGRLSSRSRPPAERPS